MKAIYYFKFSNRRRVGTLKYEREERREMKKEERDKKNCAIFITLSLNNEKKGVLLRAILVYSG